MDGVTRRMVMRNEVGGSLRQTSLQLPLAPLVIRPVAHPPVTLEAGREMARALAEQSEGLDRLALARGFCHRLVSVWWRASASQVRSQAALRPPLVPFDMDDLPVSAESLADGLGQSLAQLDTEAAVYAIGMTYTCMLPREHRAALGIYYTPPSLTARLLVQADAGGVDWARCRVLDPACGGGAFLAPVARRILDALKGMSPRHVVAHLADRLHGYEIDPFGAWLSQVALDAVMLPVTRAAGCELPVAVTVCDSLRECPASASFDLVIGNPPYGRVRLDPEDRSRYLRGLFGHANLYGLFTDLALQHARPGGVIAYVTPTSFLAGEYFKNLRALLSRDAPPATLEFVSTRKGVFEDVLQETLLATYRRGSAVTPVAIHELVPVDENSLLVKDAGVFDLPAEPSTPWILPRCAQQSSLVGTLAGMPHRLADWGYTVSTGPLVWNRHKNQLATRPGPNRYPLIWAEAVTADGRFLWRAEKRNHTPWFEVRANDDWLLTRRVCVLLQRTTAKEQARRLIATALPVGMLDEHDAVVVENHLNMLRPTTDQPPVPADVLAAFLNSTAADRAFRCVSGSVAVSAYELEALPLPAPDQLGGLCDLVVSGADSVQIDAACQRLYDGVG